MGIKIVEPKTERPFSIITADILGGKQKHPCECVIARAFMRQFSEKLLEIQVYATRTVLTWSGGRIERYRTSDRLKKALKDYDDGKGWSLEPGQYVLLPLPNSMRSEAESKRAAERRKSGDPNMDKKYPVRKKHRVPTRDRTLNLMKFRKECPIT